MRIANIDLPLVCKLFFNGWSAPVFAQRQHFQDRSGIGCWNRIAACIVSSVAARLHHVQRVHGQPDLHGFLTARSAIKACT